MKKQTNIDGYRGFQNMPMSEKTYRYRRMVMEAVYYAKTILEKNGKTLPRQEIRIVEGGDAKKMIACARMTDNCIWFSREHLEKLTETGIRQVTMHEILHSVLGVQHNENCPLMRAIYKPITDTNKLDKIFLSYF